MARLKLPKFVLKSRGPLLAVDGIILNHQHEILLTQRRIPPFLNQWVLPGGHVKYGERTEHAIVREVHEETGLQTKVLGLHGVYSSPKRDPRYHIVAVVYILRTLGGHIHPTDEVVANVFFPLHDLPRQIGFDHRQVLADFYKKYQRLKTLKSFHL